MNDITLETILLSIQTREAKDNILDKLKSSTLLDVDELELIKQYEYIYDETHTIPTPSILVNTNPQYKNMPIISSEEDLHTYTTLFIKTRLKSTVSSSIVNSIQALNNGERKTNDIIEDIVNEARRLSIVEEVAEYIPMSKDIVEMYENEDLSNRFKTGLEPVDNMCGGIPDGSVTIFMGGTGSFKTMTTTNVCYNAMNDGKNICYLSLEIKKEHMYYNFMSRHSISGKFSTPIPHKDLKNKALDESMFNQFKLISEDFENNVKGKCIVIDEALIKSFDIAGFEEIISSVDKQLVEQTGHGVDILVVDHAQLLKFSGSTKMSDPYAVVNYYVSWLRQQSLNFLGQKRAISVIIVSQTSRAGMDYAAKHGGQYLLTHAAEANELERSASYVISLYASDMTRSSNELMVQLLKSRNSETMLEPAVVKTNPAYYMIGSGVSTENVSPVFQQNQNTYTDLFSGSSNDLNAALESIFNS